jgi:hypothetical protein
VVNVHFTYTSPDSGVAGNNWANDTINRQLQIWKVDGGYCASVTDQGSFVTADGASPGNTGHVRDGITGKMKGGYTTTLLTGTLNPSLQTRGDLGPFTADTRPSFADYVVGLPNDPSSYLGAWGWTYQTASNGSWVNASTPPGNSSTDITG